MALIVEDGTGKADAESYCSLAFADAYATAMGYSSWGALSSDDRESALRRSTGYMLAVYAGRWSGSRVFADQALDWPRIGVQQRDLLAAAYYASGSVPKVVQQACVEYAYRATTADLSPDLARGVIREKVGELEVEYDAQSPQQKRFPGVDAMLSPFMTQFSGSIKVLRC